MGVKRMFSISDIDNSIDEIRKSVEARLINVLMYSGEVAVKYARENGTYQDRTANLRSSVGYLITREGEIVASDFKQTKNKDGADNTQVDGATGVQEGESYAIEIIAKNFKNGFALIVVAGMEYAVFVERRGYDVLSGAKIESERGLRKLLKQMKKD